MTRWPILALLIIIAVGAPLAFLTAPSGQAACTHWAAPSTATPPGLAGNPGTSAQPFRPQDFWAVAAAGSTLCLKDGTYQGDAYMIQAPSGKSGASGNPITVRALN